MTGCRGCLGWLVLLVLLAWAVGTVARPPGWSDTATGSFFLVVLALLAIRGSGRRPAARSARTTDRSAAPNPVLPDLRSTEPIRRWDASRSPRSAHPRRTLPPNRTGRARDPLPAQLRFRILQRDGFRCRYCGRPGSVPGVVLHVDHVVPLAAGGAAREDNLRTACEECNLAKGTWAMVAGGV